MEQKTQSFSAVVTVCILCVLTVVAWLYKIGKNQEAQSLQSDVAKGRADTSRSPAAGHGHKRAATGIGNLPDWEYEVLTGCELVESRANDGSTFRVRHRDNEYVFQLYFVDAPETTMNNPDRIRDQTQYFNYINENQLLETGSEAREFALKLLRADRFTVFTRWEKLLQSHRYYGLIQVMPTAGERRFLSELLANRGYATLDGNGRKLPNGVQKNVYRDHLRGLELLARKSRVGGWRGQPL